MGSATLQGREAGEWLHASRLSSDALETGEARRRARGPLAGNGPGLQQQRSTDERPDPPPIVKVETADEWARGSSGDDAELALVDRAQDMPQEAESRKEEENRDRAVPVAQQR